MSARWRAVRSDAYRVAYASTSKAGFGNSRAMGVSSVELVRNARGSLRRRGRGALQGPREILIPFGWIGILTVPGAVVDRRSLADPQVAARPLHRESAACGVRDVQTRVVLTP